MLERIADGRTDLVFEYVTAGNSATSKTVDGTSLIQWCAYYGDVSAIRFLLQNGESLDSQGKMSVSTLRLSTDTGVSVNSLLNTVRTRTFSRQRVQKLRSTLRCPRLVQRNS